MMSHQEEAVKQVERQQQAFLCHYAEQHKDRIRKPVVVIETLKALDDTNFGNMADVQKAVGNIR